MLAIGGLAHLTEYFIDGEVADGGVAVVDAERLVECCAGLIHRRENTTHIGIAVCRATRILVNTCGAARPVYRSGHTRHEPGKFWLVKLFGTVSVKPCAVAAP